MSTEHETKEILNKECVNATKLLSDKRSGAVLSQELNTALNAHLESCSQCASFAEIVDRLAPPTYIDDRKQGDQLIRQVTNDFGARRRLYRKKVIAAAAAVAAIVALALSTVLRLTVPPLKTARITHTTKSDLNLLKPGQTHARLRNAIAIAVARSSEVLEQTDGDNKLNIELKTGLIAMRVAPRRNNALQVRVQTAAGSVDVVGTVFAVEASTASVRVDVLRGRVMISPLGGQPRELAAPGSFDLKLHAPAILSAKRTAKVCTLLTGNDTCEGLDITTATQTSSPSPLITKDASVERGVTRKKQAPTCEALFLQARKYRLAQNWRGAAATLKQLTQTYPGKPESATALVSLAQIQLKHLGQPQIALKNFKRYRKRNPKGHLDEEASFGIAAAYRALGKIKDESRAIAQFLFYHPNSPLAPAARARLDAVNAKSKAL